MNRAEFTPETHADVCGFSPPVRFEYAARDGLPPVTLPRDDGGKYPAAEIIENVRRLPDTGYVQQA